MVFTQNTFKQAANQEKYYQKRKKKQSIHFVKQSNDLFKLKERRKKDRNQLNRNKKVEEFSQLTTAVINYIERYIFIELIDQLMDRQSLTNLFTQDPSYSKVEFKQENEESYINRQNFDKKKVDHSSSIIQNKSNQILIASQNKQNSQIVSKKQHKNQERSLSYLNLNNQLDSEQDDDYEDFINYIIKDQSQNEVMNNDTHNFAKTQLLNQQNYLIIKNQFGNQTERIDSKEQKSNGFKYQKQVPQVSNLKKWIVKQKLQQSIKQNNSKSSTLFISAKIDDLQNIQEHNQKSQRNRSSIFDYNETIKNNFTNTKLLQTRSQLDRAQKNKEQKANSQSNINNFNEIKNNVEISESVYFKDIIFTNEMIYHIPFQVDDIQNKKEEQFNENQNTLKQKVKMVQRNDILKNNPFLSPKMQSSNAYSFQNQRKFSLNEQNLLPLLKSVNNSPLNKILPKNSYQENHEKLQISNSEFEAGSKNNRSQSLNKLIMNGYLQKNSSIHNLAQISQQEYFQNYYNTADTNHHLLSQLNHGKITLPPQAPIPDLNFIPKVMTRNANFLKKGASPTENIINQNQNSCPIQKKKDFKASQNVSAQQEIKQKGVGQNNLIEAKDQNSVVQIVNIKQSPQLSSTSQQFNKNNLQKYLLYQNKFLGQKQHEFLISNFKQINKITSQNLKNQSNVIQQDNSNSQVSKTLQQKVSSSNQSSDKLRESKVNEQQQSQQTALEHQFQRDQPHKNIPVCSFINSKQVLKKFKKPNKNSIQNQVQIENEKQSKDCQQIEENEKFEFENLQKYYDQKYENKILNSNRSTYRINKNNSILNNILKNPNNKIFIQIEQKNNNNERVDQKQYNIPNLYDSNFEEDECEQLKPWNIS